LDEKHGPDASAALLTEENPQVTAQVKNSSLVREYRLDPARYRGTRKRTLVLLGIVLLLAIGAQWYFDRHSDWVAISITALSGLIFAFREFRKNRRRWDSLVVELRSDRLVRIMCPSLHLI
jgi:hypothetical protein